MNAMLQILNLSKTFTLHHQGGVQIPALHAINLELADAECVVLHGPSGAGKSSLLRTIYGNYLASSGDIVIRHQDEYINICQTHERMILTIRQQTMGYVSQFLRVVPRVSAQDIVATPLLERGASETEAKQQAQAMLDLLNIPERLWTLAPATFSGGEQQRVNIAHGFIADYPLLLLDEPTASLDDTNSQVVIDLIRRKKASGSAILGIFHDQQVREAVADRYLDMSITDIRT